MSLDIGSKVLYKDTKGKERKGVIHAVQKVDTKSGSRVIGYLVDTGKDERVDEIVTEKGEDNVFVRQPQQVEVELKNIKPLE